MLDAFIVNLPTPPDMWALSGKIKKTTLSVINVVTKMTWVTALAKLIFLKWSRFARAKFRLTLFMDHNVVMV